MTVKMIAVDMDGTFLNDQKKYNYLRFSYIYQQLKDRNIKFVVASGNQYYQLKSFFTDINTEIAFVAENGAWIFDKDKELFCGSFSQKNVYKIINILEKSEFSKKIHYLLCGCNSAYYLKDEDERWLSTMRHYYVRLTKINQIQELFNDKLLKFALNISNNIIKHVINDINNAHTEITVATCSGYNFVDLIVPGNHKGHALNLLAQRWGISNKEILAFGDGCNDIEMLKIAGFSFAMKNSVQIVKNTARYLAPSNNDEGVLIVIEDMLSGKKPFDNLI